MPKANKDGWIRNRSGKVPNLPSTAKIEVRYRIGKDLVDPYGQLDEFDWSIAGEDSDIMAYRVVEPQEEVNPTSTRKAHRLIAIDSSNNVMAIDKLTTEFVSELCDQGFDLHTTEIVNLNTCEKKNLLDMSHLTNWK
jgi:hypothetical protein